MKPTRPTESSSLEILIGIACASVSTIALVLVFGDLSYSLIFVEALWGIAAFGLMAIAYILGKSVVACRGNARINYLWAYVIVTVLTVGMWYERVRDEDGSPRENSAYAGRIFSLMLPAALWGVYAKRKKKEEDPL
jgi:hypothetical protein